MQTLAQFVWLINTWASAIELNKFASRTSSLKLLLNLSANAFWLGFPGRMNSNAMPISFAHSMNVSDVISGPLSTRFAFGMPYTSISWFMVLSSLADGIDVPHSMRKASRLPSSITLSVLNVPMCWAARTQMWKCTVATNIFSSQQWSERSRSCAISRQWALTTYVQICVWNSFYKNYDRLTVNRK